MRLIVQLGISWLCNALVLGIVVWVFTTVNSGSTGELFVAAAIFGVLNTFLKPLLRLLTLPLAFITLGLAWFAVSMLMLWITDALSNGLNIDGFWALVWATVVVGIVNFLLDIVFFLWGRPAQAGTSAIPA